MKTLTFAAVLAALMSAPVLAQAESDNHSAHHEGAPSPTAQTATQSTCPMGMAMNGNQETMQHMAQMQQMMQMMQQMQTQMQGMHDQMTQMQSQMQGRQRLQNHK